MERKRGKESEGHDRAVRGRREEKEVGWEDKRCKERIGGGTGTIRRYRKEEKVWQGGRSR